MRLLYLTNGFPYPLTSGYLRHYFLLKELSREHSIVLMSIVGAGFEEGHVDALRPFTAEVHTFRSSSRGQSLGKKVVNQVRSYFGVEHAVQDMRAAVAERAKGERFDAVFCGKRTLPAIDDLGDVPVVADMCDATASRIRGSLRYAEPARLPLLLLEYVLVQRAERRLMSAAKHSVFVSCRDREAVLRGEVDRTTVMPNGVDLEFWSRETSERGRDTIVFTGAMNYRPNTDAALFLIEEILPRVHREVPGAKLAIVGRDPTAAIVKAARCAKAVEVTGYVDDVRPYLERATIFAAPLRFGAGIQNKVLEAMAMQVPVVASPLAADGLRTEEGDLPPLRIARDADEFAEKIGGIMGETAQDPAPDARARQFIEEHFVWPVSAAKLDRILREVAGVADRERTEEPLCSP